MAGQPPRFMNIEGRKLDRHPEKQVERIGRGSLVTEGEERGTEVETEVNQIEMEVEGR